MKSATKKPIGKVIWWRTQFGQWFKGIVRGQEKDYWIVDRTAPSGAFGVRVKKSAHDVAIENRTKKNRPVLKAGARRRPRMLRSNPTKTFGSEEKAETYARALKRRGIPALVKYKDTKAGDRWQVLSSERAREAYEYHLGGNPPVKIYDRIKEIVAVKGPGHRCDAACRRARHTYVHKFSSSASIYGMPDGSLVIR